jgi:hypothetical protein
MFAVVFFASACLVVVVQERDETLAWRVGWAGAGLLAALHLS